MRLEINIQNRHFMIILVFIIAASAVGLVVAYGGGSPSTMGHTWGEMTCDKCITTANIGDNSVTGAKIQDGSISGTDIQDGSISGTDISSIDGSKVTGTVTNADMLDNKHAFEFIGIGYTLPASTTCFSYTLTPKEYSGFGIVQVYNNRLAVAYSYQYQCTCNNYGSLYIRYYLGKDSTGTDVWSNCMNCPSCGNYCGACP